MQKIKFNNLVFNKGYNTTVRKFDKKWDKFKPGEKFEIINKEDVVGGIGTIVNVKTKQLSNITQNDIKFEHEPRCQSLDGLLITMFKFYPNMNVNEKVFLINFIFGGFQEI